MSIAGRRSNQGDEYQLRVALHWLIRLLEDSSIRGIQVDSTGIPGQDFSVAVDDIVILYNNDSACFIQAKKNEPKHEAWSLSDKVLQEELCKARDQLESHDNSKVKFYSRSPFGELKALVENCNRFPDFLAFQRDASKNWSTSLRQVAKNLARSEEEAFNLIQQFGFGPTYEFDDWDRQNHNDLDRLVPRVDLAMPILERYLASHEAGLRDSKHLITRDEVWADLQKLGLSPTPKRSEAEILATFKLASGVGRRWLCTIDGEKIPRIELSQLVELIKQGSRTILLTDRPGSGKTCLLLDLADELENTESPYGLLFIKGDQFTEINGEQDLIARGLPEDLVGQCARLAGFRRVVVVIDSLDVLSLTRQHSSLKVFLGLMDRLEKIENVTVIAACRNFDLEYDPLLRGRSWQQTVHIQPLDFETVVKPFLIRWGINPSNISAELHELLQLPQHLRIYEKLAKLGKGLNPASAYELYDSFLDEVVAQNPLLGDQAMVALQSMADHLMQARSQSCSKAVFNVSEEIVRHLISQEVLWDPSPGSLSFSHQTLADCLVVRSTLAKNKNLEKFILDHPQLPFIRPAVRAFFFFLRAHQPDSFRKQVWQVLSNDEIAYHVKRLICESLAEIIPVEDDWRLLRRIFQNYPDLFRRLLLRTQEIVWFNFLKQYWLTEAQASENREDWLRQFCWKLSIWVNECPIEVIALWREGITSGWTDRQTLVGIISSGLDKFEVWDVEGVQELLEALVENASAERSSLGKILSRWVQATNSGDDLLWRHITRNVSHENASRRDVSNQLHCKPHEFHQDNFLVERLKQSNEMLTLVLSSVEHWSNDNTANYGKNTLRTGFLWSTSWRFKHHKQEHYYVGDLEILLSALESALKYRSRQNDHWWRANELHLRTTPDATLRHLVIQAYKENIEMNLPGIENQLQDKDLLEWEKLNYELGELMQAAYPYISESAQTTNQKIILSLRADPPIDMDEPMLSSWIAHDNRKIYNLLIRIPSIFRTPEAQSNIVQWQNHFSYSQPSPDVHIWSGAMISPLSKEDLLKLSDKSLFRLLHYYEQRSARDFTFFDHDMNGGFSEIVWVLREACSLHPARFLCLFSSFVSANNLHQGYIHAVVKGIASHLHYRFGNLRPNPGDSWTPIEPLPDGKALATTLMKLLEQYSVIWNDGDTVSQALEACCDVLDDPESADRLTLLLFWACSKVPDDERDSISDNESDLVSRALNSTRGVIAKSAMKLCNRLLEKDQSLPELLPYLLHRFAHDSAIYARIPILEQLPFLLYKQPDFGWRLLSDVFQEPQPRLWKYAEQCLYYQYRDHFHQVAPYLDRLLVEGREEAGDTWGRISTLASLAGYIRQEALFEALTTANDEAWKGAAQVFTANFDRREHTTTCHSGLITILNHESLSDEAVREIESCFDKEANRGLIRHELALALLHALSASTVGYDIHDFLEWLSYEARRNPVVTLGVAEILAETLETKMRSHQIWHTQPLITALNEILREADETDDPELIKRAINLQDRFLRLDIYGIEELFNRAGQL
jgi:hypothetical protein